MSEEKRKEKHIAARIISITALVIGTSVFGIGLLVVLAVLWNRIFPGVGGPAQMYDFIAMFFIGAGLFSFIYFLFFWPITIIGLVLSIVTLFIERDRLLRLYPLLFLLVGLCILAMVFVIAFLRFLGG